MKRLRRSITASNTGVQSPITFTPSEIVELLIQIPELSGLNITQVENADGTAEFIVGDYSYLLSQSSVPTL